MTTDNSFCSCLLCRKPFENIWTHSLGHYKKVYSSSVKYLSDEIKGNYFHWNHNDQTLHPPFCTVCFKNAEKLYEIDEQLIEIQTRLSDYLTVFNLEIVNARNELIIGPCDTSNDLESFHARLLKAPNEISFIENIYTSGLEDLTSQILNTKNDIFVVENNNNEIKPGSLHVHNQILTPVKTLENFGSEVLHQQENRNNLGCLNLQHGILNPENLSRTNINTLTNKNCALEIFNSEILNGLDVNSQNKPSTSTGVVGTFQKKKRSSKENILGNPAGCYKLLDVQREPLDAGNIYASKTFGLENFDGLRNQNVQNDHLLVESPREAKTVEIRNTNESVVYYVVRKEHLVFARPPDDYSESEVASFDDYVADWSGDEESRETEILIRDLKVHKLEDDVDECIKQPSSVTQRSLQREGAISAANSVFLNVGDNRCHIETDGAQISVVLPNCDSNEAKKSAKCAIIDKKRQKLNGLEKGSTLSRAEVIEKLGVLPLTVEAQVNSCNPPLADIISVVTFPVEEIIAVTSPIENNINAVSPSLENFKLVTPIAKSVAVPPKEVVHEKTSLQYVKGVTHSSDKVKIGKNSPVEKAIVNSSIIEPKTVNSPVLEVKTVDSHVLVPKTVNSSVLEPKIVNSSVLEPKVVNSSVLEPKVVNSLVSSAKIVNYSAKKSKVASIPIKINVMIPPLKFKSVVPPPAPKIVTLATSVPVLKEVNTIPPSAPIAKEKEVNIYTPSAVKSAAPEITPELKVFTDVASNDAEIFTFYPRKSKKKREIKKGHPAKGYLCQVCDITFPLTVDLDLHSTDTGHKNEKEFKCPQCEKKYYKSADLKYHQRTHKGKELVICTVCHKSFQNKGTFKMHCKSHSSTYPTCKICNLKFGTQKDLTDHSAEHDQKNTTEPKRNRQNSKESLNRDCATIVDEAKGPRMASREKEVVGNFKCNICEVDFGQALELESHCLESGHVTEKTFECSQCPNKYYRKTDLKFHRGMHKSFKIFICSICSETFSNKITFKNHFKIHDGEYPKCDECEIKFAKIDDLQDHIFVYHQSKQNSEECNGGDKRDEDDSLIEVNENISADKVKKLEETRKLKKCNLTGRNFVSKGYLCQVCSTVFPHSAYLDFHNLETGHVNEKAFSCSECSKKFYKKTDLKYHRRVHREPITYSCNICPAIFRSKVALKNHFKNHPGFPECTSCAIKFVTITALEEHVKNHKDNIIKCDVCHEEFRWTISLKYHQKRFHLNKPKNPKGNYFYCDLCKSVFDEEKALEDHSLETSHTTEKKYKCSYCNDAFYRIKDLTSHKKSHTKTKTYQCNVCTRIFSKNHKLKDHMRVHTGDFFSCLFCPSTFVKKVSLERHLERHSGVVHVCEFCGKSFKDKGRYRNHRRLHTGECFLCHLCPKKCYTKKELNDHNNIHNGIKPYRCHVCDKTFYTIMRLQKHRVTHRPKEDVSCLICKKQFDSQKKLEYHMKLHTEESFQCTFCEKKYLSKQILEDHIKFLHQGTKEFPCKICSKIFYSNTQVVQHQRTHLAEIRANRHNNNNCSNIPNKNYTHNNNCTDVTNNNFINSSKLPADPKNNCSNIPNGNSNGLKINITNHTNKCIQNNSSNGSIKLKNNRSNDLNNSKCKRSRTTKAKKKLPFACHLCQESFKRPEQLRKHIVEHDYPKPSFHTIVFKQD